MSILEKKPLGGVMDFDSADEYVENGDFRSVTNFNNNLPLENDGGRLKAVYSTGEITFPLDINDVFIGHFSDALNETIYTFVFNPENVLNKIFITNTVERVPRVMFRGSGLQFANKLILDAAFVDGYFLFVQEGSDPKMIVVERGLQTFSNIQAGEVDYPTGNNYTDITLIVPPPLNPPQVRYVLDGDTASNEIKGNLYSFQYRYLYKDKRESKYSPISRLIAPQVQLNEYTGNQDYPFNAIEVTYERGRFDVVGVEIICRINFNDPVVVVKIDIDNSTSTLTTGIFRFYNDGLYRAEDNRIANQLFDAVPLEAKTMTLANNSVVFANYKLGYDLPDFTPVKQELIEEIDKSPQSLTFTSSVSHSGNSGVVTTTNSGIPPIETSDNSTRSVQYRLTIPPVIPAGYRVYFRVSFGMFNGINFSSFFVFNFITTQSTLRSEIYNRIRISFENYASSRLFQDFPNQFIQGIFNTQGLDTFRLNFSTDVNRPFSINAFHISEPLGVGIFPALKANVTHKFGFTFHDFANRSSFVKGVDNYRFSGIYQDNSTFKGFPVYGIPAKSVPSWVRQINLLKNDVQQPTDFITVPAETVDNTGIAALGQSKLNIKKIIDYNEQFGSILSYDFVQGDLVRILAKKDGEFKSYNQIDDLSVVGVDTENGAFNLIVRDDNQALAATEESTNEYIIQIYRPIKSVSLDEELYNETGISVNVSNYTGLNALITSFFSQGGTVKISVSKTQEIEDLTLPSVVTANGLPFNESSNNFNITAVDSITTDSVVFTTDITDPDNSFSDVTQANLFINIANLQVPSHYVFSTQTIGDIYLKKRLFPLPTDELYVEDNNFSDFFDSKTYMKGRPNKVERNVLIKRPVDMCHGRQYVAQVKYNSLSDFVETDFTDVAQINFGHIQRVHFVNDRVYVFQEANTGFVMVQREMVLSPSGGQDTLTASANFFASTMNYYSGEYGVRDRSESVLVDNNTLYFPDTFHKKLIRIGGSGAFPISNYKANSYFLDRLKKLNEGFYNYCFITKEDITEQVLINFVKFGLGEEVEVVRPYEIPVPEGFVVEEEINEDIFIVEFDARSIGQSLKLEENGNNPFSTGIIDCIASPESSVIGNGNIQLSYSDLLATVAYYQENNLTISLSFAGAGFTPEGGDLLRYSYSSSPSYEEPVQPPQTLSVSIDNLRINNQGIIEVVYESSSFMTSNHTRVGQGGFVSTPSDYITTAAVGNGFWKARVVAVFGNGIVSRSLSGVTRLPEFSNSETIHFSEAKNGFTSFCQYRGLLTGKFGNKNIYYLNNKGYISQDVLNDELNICGQDVDATFEVVSNISPSDVKIYKAVSLEVESGRSPKETEITTPNGQRSIIPTVSWDKRENNIYSEILMDLNTPSETEAGEAMAGALYNGNPVRDRVAKLKFVFGRVAEAVTRIFVINVNVSKSNRSNQ